MNKNHLLQFFMVSEQHYSNEIFSILMASASKSLVVNTPIQTGGDTSLVAINTGSQLPWSSLLPTLLHGLLNRCLSSLARTFWDILMVPPYPPFWILPTNTSSDGTVTEGTSNLAFLRWFRQDKLILHAILVSVSEPVMPLIAASSTARDAWSKLQR